MFKRLKRQKQNKTKNIENGLNMKISENHSKVIKRLLEMTLTPSIKIENDMLRLLSKGFDLPYVIGEQFILKNEYNKIFQTSSYHTCLEYTLTILYKYKFSQEILIYLMKLLNDFQKCELVLHGLKVSNKKYLLSTYDNCFEGKDCVDFILYYKMSNNRNNAILLGQSWLKNKCIKHVTDQHSFKDSDYYYKFNKHNIIQKSYQSNVSIKNRKFSGNKYNNNNSLKYKKNILSIDDAMNNNEIYNSSSTRNSIKNRLKLKSINNDDISNYKMKDYSDSETNNANDHTNDDDIVGDLPNLGSNISSKGKRSQSNHSTPSTKNNVHSKKRSTSLGSWLTNSNN